MAKVEMVGFRVIAGGLLLGVGVVTAGVSAVPGNLFNDVGGFVVVLQYSTAQASSGNIEVAVA